jgi:diaminohydroxyphosphoribosylaminopyrimidine deaminase/5-amino-6-(5-phosphoribosylamino)uracil reductase
MAMTTDESFMFRCLELARMGRNRVTPNPMVGALVVHNNQIIGEGYHREFGQPHAEVNALNSVKNKALLSESTMYVNLEPCSHYGKTPPCSNLIVESKLKKVVIGCLDSNPEVAGKGLKYIRNNGIEVSVGVLEKESRFINRRFFTFHEKKRPYIILKWARSADGYMDVERKTSDPEIHWISTVQSKRLVHTWRAMEPAILIGRTTAVNDDPELTTREVAGKNPTRILFDPQLKTSIKYKIYNKESKTLVYNYLKREVTEGIEWIQVARNQGFIQAMLSDLYQRNILSVIVEGGKKTFLEFIENGMWDEVRIINGKVFFKRGLKAPDLHKNPDYQYQIGTDRVDIYYA